MRLTSSIFALVTAVTVLHSETAHAQSHPRSKSAYGTGVALTVTGSIFCATGIVAGVGSVIIASSASSSEGGGIALALAFVGGLVWAGSTAIGVATLVPGIVLMVKNAPLPSREPVYREAHFDVPAPRFVSIPILSGSF